MNNPAKTSDDLNSESNALLSVPFFRGVDKEALRFIENNSTTRNLHKGEYLFFADDRCKNLYIVKSGIMKVFLIGEDGKEVVMHYVEKGRFLGDTILFNEDPYGANARAVEDSELIVIGNKKLEKIISQYPEIGIGMLADFGRRLKKMMSLMGEMALSDVRKRLVRLIMELAEKTCNGNNKKNGKVVLYQIPKQDEMASMIGTKREVFSRELHKLRKKGLISVQRGKIIIEDIEKLRREIIKIEMPVFPTYGSGFAMMGHRKDVS